MNAPRFGGVPVLCRVKRGSGDGYARCLGPFQDCLVRHESEGWYRAYPLSLADYKGVPMTSLGAKGSLVTGVAAAVGASICCVGPLLLLALGVSGAWIGSLTELEPYRPYLIGLTMVFLGLSFRELYLVPQACAAGTLCADPRSLRRQRLVFWVVCLLLLALIAVPWVAPFLY